MEELDITEIRNALQKVKETYGVDIAKIVESIFRTETKHFKSDQFQQSFSPGMEAFSDIAPYGWNKCDSFWTKNHNYHPIGILKMVENTSALMKSRGERRFVKFDTVEAAMMTVADVIHNAGGNGGAWNSNDAKIQKQYSDYLLTVIPRITNTLA